MGDPNSGQWVWTRAIPHPIGPATYGPPSMPPPPFAPPPPEGGRREWHPGNRDQPRISSDYDYTDGFTADQSYAGSRGGWTGGRGHGSFGGAYGRGRGRGYGCGGGSAQQGGYRDFDDRAPRDHRANFYQGRGGPPRGRGGRGGYGEGRGRDQQQRNNDHERALVDGSGPINQGNMPMVPRPGQPSIRLCINTALGRDCRHGQCVYSHADKSSRPCKYWHGKGRCDKGLDCLMGHNEAAEAWARCSADTVRGNDPMNVDGVGAVRSEARPGVQAPAKDYQA
jgi:hypothetical protein